MGKEINMYSVIDLETTGGEFNKERIIEIGIIITDGKKVLDSFNELVNPRKKVDFYVEKLTGIKNKDLENKKEFSHFSERIQQMISNTIIVGHDVQYDYRVLINEFKKIQVEIKNETFCTFSNFKNKFPELKSYKLNSLCEHFNIELKNHHRAYDDAKATFELFRILNELSCQKEDSYLSCSIAKTEIIFEVGRKMETRSVISFVWLRCHCS